MAHTRREFLRRTGCALTGSAMLAAGFGRFGLISALAQQPNPTDYKALVCILLDGGNDGNNTVIPYDDYGAAGGYAAVRGASGMAVPKADLLQITPPAQAGRKFGLHPNLTELQALFTQGRLAVLCNTGVLLQPLTRTLYQSGVGHPYQLFSHSDQIDQQQTAISTQPSQLGWGGRISDALKGVNGASPLPMVVSVAGTSLFATGETTRQLVIRADRRLNETLVLDAGLDHPAGSRAARSRAFERILADAGQNTLLRASSETLAQGIGVGQSISVDPTLPALQPGQTGFPVSTLGTQLKQVAKIISLRATFGLRRQIFFCTYDGFDTHANQRGALGHDGLLSQLSQAMKAFYDATVNLGVSAQVTTFTLSDFGRTLEPSGTGSLVGSDHAWGNHHFIMGDAVRGGDFYGTFPTLALGGPDDADTRGRWIPTTSMDQYAATLAAWYGLAAADVPIIFPFIGRFSTANLGFML